MITFNGSTACVTGGATGIGAAIVSRLAKFGLHVGFSYCQSEQQANNLVAKLKDTFAVNVCAFQVDLRNQDQAKQFYLKLREQLGPMDYLVNNAGISKPASLAFMTDDAWQDVIDVNLSATAKLAQLHVQYLLKAKAAGAIVNISSLFGLVGDPGQTNYCASKFAVHGFTRALAKEVAQRNIRVNAVAPGFVETDMLRDLSEEKKNSIKKPIPMQRFGTADEVADAVCFLLSDAANYITGQILVVDGGLGT